MDAEDRRFVSRLGLVFGPLFVVAGFLAAFTIVGAMLIWLGLSLLAAGVTLRAPLPAWVALALGASIFALLTTYTLTVYP